MSQAKRPYAGVAHKATENSEDYQHLLWRQLIMSLQLELIPPTPTVSNLPILRDVIAGNVVQLTQNKKLVMKLKPTNFLLNSNLVADILNRGDCFIVDLAKGTLYIVSGELTVTKLNSKLQYSVKEVS